MALYGEVTSERNHVLDGAGATELDLFVDAAARSGHADMLGPLIGLWSFQRAAVSGDQERMRAAAALLGQAADPGSLAMAAFAEMAMIARSGEVTAEFLAALDRTIAACEASAAHQPADEWTPAFLLPILRSLRSFAVPTFGRAATESPPPHLRARAFGCSSRPSGGFSQDEIAATLAEIMSVLGAVAAVESAGASAVARQLALSQVEQVLSALPRGRAAWIIGATGIAAQWLSLGRDGGVAHAVDRAVAWAEDALGSIRVENPPWADTALLAAEARRLRAWQGDRDHGRALGLSALRARTWQVLLQSGTEHGRVAARAAAADARRVAEWCVADRALNRSALDDLVAALDAGRGLVLHAAVTMRSVADRLTVLGRPELAQEWIRAGGADRIELPGMTGLGADLHGDLRERVLGVLAAEAAELLDPPTPEEIRAALRTHGSDALAYLVPGEGDQPGRVVIVFAAGPVEVLTLPELRTGPDTPLERYAVTHAAWNGGAHNRGEERRDALGAWRAALGELTGWAGRAAGDALLAAATRRAADPGCPRLVLVPMGALALVPWHAACLTGGPAGVRAAGVRAAGPRPSIGGAATGTGTGTSSAPVLAAHAVISYIPSARLLCRAVRARPTPGGKVLVVGDPDAPDLPRVGADAGLLRSAFYPDAPRLGRPRQGQPSDGPGTPAEVLAWLRADMDRAVLHLACHARAEPTDPARSYLTLAGGERLTIDSLLRDRPTAGTPVDRVFLVACSTNVTGTDYDEAFSITTAFLAAGARTVFGSMWPVPDGLTARFVFMLHHYLQAERRTPADALHQVARWARDPDRAPPPSMPRELMARRYSMRLDDPAVWAGFVHVGV